MIVFSDRTRTEDPRTLVAALQARIAAPGSAAPSTDDLTTLLIEAGALESAVADALQPDRDDAPRLVASLSAVPLDLARAERRFDLSHLVSAARWLELVAAGDLPSTVRLSEPDGFAYYGLHPVTYRVASRRFLEAVRPDRVVALGLRTIGATLAAVVAAEIEAAGVPVESASVRPRGHPWDREVHLGPRFARWLEGAAQGHVLIVDEGPGLSGTSFAAAAEAASRAGAPDERVHLLTSWDADGSTFRSDRARERWRRHRRWCATFEETVLGRLASPWNGGALRDLSGGLWLDVCWNEADAGRPVAHPHHERRKYLLARPGKPSLLLKFAGLGTRGERSLARAEAQADAGLAPGVLGLSDGFLAYRHLPGRPMTQADLGPEVIAAMARHLFVVARDVSGQVRFDDILAMTRLNLREAFGHEPDLAWMASHRDAVCGRPAVACDGRMMPHEWLLSGSGIVKTDGIDHHDDHFWPGTHDVAWDLAGAMIEWRMAAPAREALTTAYVSRTGDSGVRAVLPFHEAAYLAWRLGYTSLAAETPGSSADGALMAAERDRIRSTVEAVLARHEA